MNIQKNIQIKIMLSPDTLTSVFSTFLPVSHLLTDFCCCFNTGLSCLPQFAAPNADRVLKIKH